MQGVNTLAMTCQILHCLNEKLRSTYTSGLVDLDNRLRDLGSNTVTRDEGDNVVALLFMSRE